MANPCCKLLACLSIAILASAYAEKSGEVRRGPMMTGLGESLQQEEPKIREHQERIEAELETLDRDAPGNPAWVQDWAGEYRDGDGLGTNIRLLLAPDEGIAFTNYGCLGFYGGDHGSILGGDEEGLDLELVFGSENNSFLSERVYFIRWDDRQYLASDWQLMKIVNSYNRGGWYRGSMYGIPRLVTERDQTNRSEQLLEPITSKPELPARYAAMLIDDPINLRVTSVSDYDVSNVEGNRKLETCSVVFDRGVDANIHAGMEFRYRLNPDSAVIGRYKITFSDNGISEADFDIVSWVKADTSIPKRGDLVPAGPVAQE